MGLAIHRVGTLTFMLARYFVRRVLNVGPLRSWGARAILALVLCGFVIGGAAIAVQFLRPLGTDMATWRYVYDISSVSIAMTALAVFLGLRLLVDGSQNLVEFTYQLPVSHRERRAAIFGFEIACVLAVTLVLASSMGVASLLILGTPGLALAMAPVVTAPSAHTAIRRFVNVPQPGRARGPWLVHFAYAARNQHLWLSVSLTVAVFAYLSLARGLNPLWACLLLCFPAMYHYGNTRCLRLLHPERGSWRIWGYMILAQFAVVGAFLLAGIAVLAAWWPDAIASGLEPVAGVLGAVVCSVLVGSAFPAENDNPLSVLVGCLVLGICLAFVGVIAGLFNLPGRTGVLIVALTVLAGASSVWFINSHERRSRYDLPQTVLR